MTPNENSPQTGNAWGELLHCKPFTLNIESSKRQCKMGGLNAIELFAGVGGFRLGLERAGHRVVWANEWDRFACDTYDKNFPGEINRQDIRAVDASDIPKHDLIVGGFPCQAFSVAGKRGGFSDTRGTLFFEIARIAAYHRTPYLLLENVKGLLSHDEGRTFGTILKVLDDMGYDCQWQVLNSKDFGVPQNRERVIIVGHLRDRSRPKVFPLEVETNGLAIRRHNRPKMARNRLYDGSGLAPTLQTGTGGGHELYIWDGERYRKATPLEGERLQSFPDGWTEGVSDSQRYKQMGNAVTTNVIEAVAHLLPKEA